VMASLSSARWNCGGMFAAVPPTSQPPSLRRARSNTQVSSRGSVLAAPTRSPTPKWSRARPEPRP
jgi:hypothetical protein